MPARELEYAAHSIYSDPGSWTRLLDEVPTEPAELGVVARNVIGHYRANADELPEATRDEINLRWLDRILAADQSRNPLSLDAERPMAARVQGCCRDHTLFCVGALRQQGIPARSRVGFASYFRPDWNHDHVVVEVRRDGRWVRFDPELEPSDYSFDTLDMPVGQEAPFRTAAEVWRGHRAGELDVETFGVDIEIPVRGEWFVGSYVLMEVAHRFKDELLLWDGWGIMGPEVAKSAELVDVLAELLVTADADDDEAEAELLERYRSDARLHPGERIQTVSPYDGSFSEVSLVR